ncbi:MAG TPA: molecular chaperone HtpG [Firmicutes bacterium]|nr:molecular chaperone HtpG [Bacillota bacterium]
MTVKPFQAEARRLLDLMINSIYTHKEIFLRELISNASDAIDKIYYKALTDETVSFNKDDYYIRIIPDRRQRTLTIRDTGIGMTKEELGTDLGVIARSGSLAFKQAHESRDGYDLIGQFGVGFYSAFMVADVVTVISRALNSGQAYKWEARGAEGYTIEPCEKEKAGTEIILKLKENTEDERYDEFLEEYRLRELIKKYSDFIRYPIIMKISKTRKKAGSDNEYETYEEDEVINSMVPIWKKNKNELTAADYENFYAEKRYGFDKPLTHLHISAEGTVSYKAILYIPERIPFDYYTREYEKGLELYANGVLVMNKCADLLPDCFSFVKGLVDSEDLSLNISREMLQHDRQLKVIAKNIKNKIKSELENMLRTDREKYETFFRQFGRQLKYGIYSDFGREREFLQDLLLFYSSTEKKLVTLAEYVTRMPAEQKYIYYAAGPSVERIEKLPQTELVADRGFEILYFTEDIDEFAIRMLGAYKEKEFRSVAGGDLGLPESEDRQEEEKSHAALFKEMAEILEGKVNEVRASRRLKNHPVCLASEGELTIEMEKVLSAMPNRPDLKAERILEVNTNHPVFAALGQAFANDTEKFRLYTELLYNQALLIEGLSVEDPLALSEKICRIMV